MHVDKTAHPRARAFLCTVTLSLLAGIPALPAQSQDFSCPKPLAIPDRWDDEDGDGHYDHAEPLTVDINGNGQYEPGMGDQFHDLNKDGTFDNRDEFYDPIVTGYFAPGDVGISLVLLADNNPGPVVPGQYFPIAFPAANRGDPLNGAEWFGKWLLECSPYELAVNDSLFLEPGARIDTTIAAFLSFVNQDPTAYWDEATQSVQGSQFVQSPRIVTLLAFDPQPLPESTRSSLILAKFLSLFVESIGPGSQINTRIVDAGLGVPTPNAPATWGSLKNKYRTRQ